MTIYCSNPGAEYTAYKHEVDDAIARVLKRGQYVLGNEVAAFEEEFADWLGVTHATAVNSGTDALFLAMKALDIGDGDEVIVPSLTATATVSAVYMSEAKPVFVDVEHGFYTVDKKAVESAITSRTKAVIAVHLYGQVADMDALVKLCQENNLLLIEDCAQAHGAMYKKRYAGCMGDVGCFSFYPTKNLGALGDAGAVVSHHSAINERISAIRQYGWNESRVAQQPGYNSRCDELQAAVLRVKLKYLESSIQARNALAEKYSHGLPGELLTTPAQRSWTRHAFHLYVIQTEQRDELNEFLKDKNIYCGVHYDKACHQMPAFEHERVSGKLRETECLVDRILSLPIYPQLSLAEQDKIMDAVCQFYQGNY